MYIHSIFRLSQDMHPNIALCQALPRAYAQ